MPKPQLNPQGWVEYLEAFREQVYPIFENQGVSFEVALQVWWLNRIDNSVAELEADEEADESWKSGN